MLSSCADSEPDWPALVASVRAGEETAARALVEQLYPQVAGRISRLLPRREEIEDLAQEVFLRLFSRLGQFHGGSFPAWVDAITRRVCYDALRKRRVRPEWRFADLDDDPAEPASEAAPAEVDSAAVVAALLAQLPPEQAWLLQQVELEGRSIGELSAELSWTATGGRLRLFRARNALKRAYERWKENTAE